MQSRIRTLLAAAVLTVLGAFVYPSGAFAQGTSVPQGTSVHCKDGSVSKSVGRGACSHHGGVDKTAIAPTPRTERPTATDRATEPTSDNRAASDRGGSTKVWVNTKSGVYHCPGTRWYGATKSGQYMTESEARAAGDRPAYGRTCG
jgi:hypothetical protein